MKRNWRRTLGQHLRYMTADQVRASMLRIRVRGPVRDVTIDQPEIRKLTGGYTSQNINFYTVRKLAEKLRELIRIRDFDPTEQSD